MKKLLTRHIKKIGVGAAVLSAIGHIVAWMLLPKQLVLQITSEGTAGNVLPSWLFFGLSTIAAAIIWIGAAYAEKNRSKWMVFSVLVLFMDAVTIILNMVGWQNLIS